MRSLSSSRDLVRERAQEALLPRLSGDRDRAGHDAPQQQRRAQERGGGRASDLRDVDAPGHDRLATASPLVQELDEAGGRPGQLQRQVEGPAQQVGDVTQPGDLQGRGVEQRGAVATRPSWDTRPAGGWAWRILV
jgi:hypothetical protein